ncbi:hypothetical protein LOK49_LG13G02059 [Camellia lanceoleosa]|uniref:Uncharacterized protein n=1 Tax=Camellia lanceoleosa TaxID=1840588 RepID=A0ACC0FNI4_9ERIC|nr:hypothetical protein LOK49_LG13G02059 [Camellia lanceoleosa]
MNTPTRQGNLTRRSLWFRLRLRPTLTDRRVNCRSNSSSTTASSTLTLSSRNNTGGNKSKNAVASSTSLHQKTLSPISELKELASSLSDSAKRHLDRLH